MIKNAQICPRRRQIKLAGRVTRARAKKQRPGPAWPGTAPSAVDPAATWTPGVGKAHLNADFWSEPFNCRMVGTFNLKTKIDITAYQPAMINFKKGHKFWLVRLNGERYGWAMRWTGSRMANTTLEVITKQALPEEFKRAPVRVEVLERWPDERIKKWASGIHFFQTFEWGPQEANSKLVWQTINRVSWRGKTVLDIGCNFGYHSFQASKAGAAVSGWDANPNVLPVARTINDHIEMCDVDFSEGRFPEPGQKWDVIFCFSVIHQDHPGYAGLEEICRKLKDAARERVFFELIVPSLDGKIKEDEIDRIIGGTPLLKYRHAVRHERKIYDLEVT